MDREESGSLALGYPPLGTLRDTGVSFSPVGRTAPPPAIQVCWPFVPGGAEGCLPPAPGTLRVSALLVPVGRQGRLASPTPRGLLPPHRLTQGPQHSCRLLLPQGRVWSLGGSLLRPPSNVVRPRLSRRPYTRILEARSVSYNPPPCSGLLKLAGIAGSVKGLRQHLTGCHVEPHSLIIRPLRAGV